MVGDKVLKDQTWLGQGLVVMVIVAH